MINNCSWLNSAAQQIDRNVFGRGDEEKFLSQTKEIETLEKTLEIKSREAQAALT